MGQVEQMRRRLAMELLSSNPEEGFALLERSAESMRAAGDFGRVSAEICPSSVYGAQEMVFSDSGRAAHALERAQDYCSERRTELLQLAELHHQLGMRNTSRNRAFAAQHFLFASDLFESNGDPVRAGHLRDYVAAKLTP